jgi:hypothetical protein
VRLLANRAAYVVDITLIASDHAASHPIRAVGATRIARTEFSVHPPGSLRWRTLAPSRRGASWWGPGRPSVVRCGPSRCGASPPAAPGMPCLGDARVRHRSETGGDGLDAVRATRGASTARMGYTADGPGAAAVAATTFAARLARRRTGASPSGTARLAQRVQRAAGSNES